MSGYIHAAAYDTGRLPVGDIHTLHYEQYGKADGKPVLFLHGGPGGSTSISNTAFFDPSVYRVVLYDQRGAGQSIPVADLRENFTSFLISDIEILRKHLKVDKWHMVFGGSWGSTLALLYAEDFPEQVSSLVLRGVFLVRKFEEDWNNPTPGSPAACMFPEAAEELLTHFTKDEQKNWYATAYERLKSDDKTVALKMARALNKWDITRSALLFDPATLEKVEDDTWSLQHALLETHYILHGCWLEENQILENIDSIRHIPCIIVQGRYDNVCPPVSAWDLHKTWPESRLVMVPDAGHGALEPGTFKELIKACDEFVTLPN